MFEPVVFTVVEVFEPVVFTVVEVFVSVVFAVEEVRSVCTSSFCRSRSKKCLYQ